MGSQYPPSAYPIHSDSSDCDGLGAPALAAAWRCDLSDDSLRWTAGVFDLFGLPRFMTLDRRDIVAMYEPESRALLERLRGAAIADCGSFTFEARIRRFDGAPRWIRITADVAVESGKARHLYGLKQDVTAEMTASGRPLAAMRR